MISQSIKTLGKKRPTILTQYNAASKRQKLIVILENNQEDHERKKTNRLKRLKGQDEKNLLFF